MKTKLFFAIMIAAAQLTPVLDGEDTKAQGEGWRRHRNERFANLPADERQKLQALHSIAMQDPAIKAAHDKLRHAHKEFRDAMRTAMLKADPTIQPILDKMPKGNRDED